MYMLSYFAQSNDSSIRQLSDVLALFLMKLKPAEPYNLGILKKYIEKYYEYYESETLPYAWKDSSKSVQFKDQLFEQAFDSQSS